MKNYALLKKRLDELCHRYHADYLHSDPLKFLHRYERPEDQEVVGIIVASLAYGRVGKILGSVETVLQIMGPRPADYILFFDPEKGEKEFHHFVHRFNKGEDVACLIWFLKQIMDTHGSLGNLFREISDNGARPMRDILTLFSEFLLSLSSAPFYGKKHLPEKAGVRYFFPSPLKGSACKRLNLFMRWMVRSDDGLDLGLWDFIPPASLIIPLDTHIARLSKYLGLTSLNSPGWKMAQEITDNLKALDPEDPLRYDFALCRLGILDLCPQRQDEKKCSVCTIRDICLL